MKDNILLRIGPLNATLITSIPAVVMSAAMTYGLALLLAGSVNRLNIVVSYVAPAVIAPALLYLIFVASSQLIEVREQVRQLSITDELTHAYNRRYFIEEAEKEFARARRHGDDFSIALFDIDDFKHINDTYGHLAGDQVLCEVSRASKQSIRETDLFARYGGEEFIFLFPKTPAKQVGECTERIRDAIESMKIPVQHGRISVTVSMGVHALRADDTDLDTMLKNADEALYHAKETGKNRVVTSQELPV